MKNIIILLFLSAFSAVFSSCSDDQKYSCNKKINAWVVDHKDEIKTMDRVKWKTLPEDLKNPTFSAFTQAQKISFWKDKLSTVSKLKWDNKELEHIQKLYSTINQHPEWFDVSKRTEDINDELSVYLYDWIKYAEDDLHWSKKLVGSIVASGDDVIDRSGALSINSVTYLPPETGLDKPTCNCNQNHDFCDNWGTVPTGKCKNTDCVSARAGCGWLLVEGCDGQCVIV